MRKFLITTWCLLLASLCLVAQNGVLNDTVKTSSLKATLPIAAFAFEMPDPPCLPVKVIFTNKSEYDSLSAKMLWDFGSGTFLEVTDDVIIRYFFDSVVHVRLKVIDNNGSDEITKDFNFFNKPKADFKIENGIGCNEIEVTLSSNSIKGDAEIIDWQWDFRDGTVQNGKEVTKTYDQKGTYDVLLKITDANGCISYKEYEDKIKVLELLNADFEVDKPFWCKPDYFQLNLKNNSIENPLTYKWYLSNGGFSVQSSPTFYIDKEGSYDVALRIDNEYGCSDSVMKYSAINIVDSAISFSMNNGVNIRSGDIVCPGGILFENASRYNADFSWYINDTLIEDTSLIKDGNDLLFDFYFPGLKFITLQLGSQGCLQTYTDSLYIDTIMAKFNIDKPYACQVPQTFNFKNKSLNANSYIWRFPDGTSASTKDVKFTINQVDRNNDPYLREVDSIVVPIILEASNLRCTSKLEKNIVYSFPTARVMPDKKDGCVPLSINFESYSKSDCSIKLYKWMVDDVVVYTGNVPNYQYTFNNSGAFKVNLVVENDSGCVDKSTDLLIEAGNVVVPKFTIPQKVKCNKTWLRIENTTPYPEQYDYFRLLSNEAFSSKVLNGKVDSVLINAAQRGDFNVEMVAVQNGCVSKSSAKVNVTVATPVAAIKAETLCKSIGEFRFYTDSSPGNKITWNFGSGAYAYTDDTTYKYPTDGIYHVKLNIENTITGCADNSTIDLQKQTPEAVFITSPDTFACVDNEPESALDIFYLDGYASNNMANYCGAAPFLWNMGNDKEWVRTSNKYYSYNFKSGERLRKIQLVVENNDRCTDTMFRNYDVLEPKIDFAMDTISGCYPQFDVEFTNLLPDTSVVSWYWIFNDSDSSFNTEIDTFTYISTSQRHFYPSLTVIDSFGCDIRLFKDVTFIKPDPDFLNDTAIIPALKLNGACINDTLQFTVIPQYKSDSSHWFIDTAFFSTKQASYVFTKPGKFQLKHVVFNQGCTDTSIRTIDIEQAIADFRVFDTVQECNLEMKFLHESTTGTVQYGKSLWTFDTLGHTGAYLKDTVYFTYTTPGKHWPRLDIETRYGCKDSYSTCVEIIRPWANYKVSADEICTSDTLHFEIDTMMYFTNYFWIMENNEIISEHKVDRVVNQDGVLSFGIYIENDTIPGCSFDEKFNVVAHDVQANFSFINGDSIFCPKEEFKVVNESQYAVLYLWKDSDGYLSSLQIPNIENPNKAGNYYIELKVTSIFGCVDSLQKKFIVRDNPEVIIIGDSIYCEGIDSLQLSLNTSQNDLIYNWSPQQLFTDYQAKDSWVIIDNTTNVSVWVKNSDNCVGFDTQQVRFIPYPQITRNLGRYDTVTYPGSNLVLGVNSSNPSSFVWEPYFEVDQPYESHTIVYPEADSTVFYVIITDECFVNKDSFLVYIEPRPIVSMPNAFYPLGNYANQKVYVRGIGITQLLEFTVFNRWGNEVFKTDDLNTPWTGYKDNKLLPQGSYAYTVKVVDYLGKEHALSGVIMLLY